VKPIRFQYFYRGDKQLYACIATDGENYGYAVANPRDRNITRKLARRIATGRLAKCRVFYDQDVHKWKVYRHFVDPSHVLRDTIADCLDIVAEDQRQHAMLNRESV
jgi:hypothetical protein